MVSSVIRHGKLATRRATIGSSRSPVGGDRLSRRSQVRRGTYVKLKYVREVEVRTSS